MESCKALQSNERKSTINISFVQCFSQRLLWCLHVVVVQVTFSLAEFEMLEKLIYANMSESLPESSTYLDFAAAARRIPSRSFFSKFAEEFITSSPEMPAPPDSLPLSHAAFFFGAALGLGGAFSFFGLSSLGFLGFFSLGCLGAAEKNRKD